MKEEDKYYIPTIEEFRIGFIYEEYNAGSGNDYTIVSFDYDHWKLIKAIYDQKLQEGWLRVKYLDKEDIESLGFVLRNSYKSFDMFFYNKSLNPNFQKDGIELIYYYDNHRLVIQSDINHFTHGERVYFDGYIKNKSELKVLLKQLGIE